MCQSRRLHQKICGQGTENVTGQTFSAILMKLFITFYRLLKMSHGQTLPDLEFIKAKSLNIAKPKLFFKNI
jgi:hypothetical protein